MDRFLKWAIGVLVFVVLGAMVANMIYTQLILEGCCRG